MAHQMFDDDPTIKERTGFQDALLTQLASSLQNELRTAEMHTASTLYADTVTQMLSAHLLRNYTGRQRELRTEHRKLSSQQLQRLQIFIDEHLARPLSLEQLARQIGFSPYHFARLFRQSTGESPHQFVLQKRLQKAQYLLKTTNKSLTEIALEIGFPNPSHFAQTFRRHLGLTPSHYRLQE
jgi:AraC family transcriptional regulator